MKHATTRAKKRLLLPGVLTLVAVAITMFTGGNVSANHPVLVEGNCDSPVPGTTLVSPGTCGDFDGDGRIGTAEDTDGADRIFGTISAAVGPGTGAAAGTGANMNGSIIIVASGRYAELITITSTNVGNVQIEAAPGVTAQIDAVLQGDPAGGNAVRQNGTGITVDMSGGSTVTLRNLVISNYAEGVRANGFSRVYVENCDLANNRDYGLVAANAARLNVNGSRITSTGRRVPVTATPAPGHGITYLGGSGGTVSNTAIINSFAAALSNQSFNMVRVFNVVTADNDGGSIVGNPVIQGNF